MPDTAHDPFEDGELEELFSAFDAAGASTQATARTLEALFGSRDDVQSPSGRPQPAALPAPRSALSPADAEPDAAALQDSVGECGANEALESAERPQACPAADRVQATAPAHSTQGRRIRLRLIRAVAIAACLAFACIGGAAWALPSAHVDVRSDDGSVSLGVNRFGITVAAEADTSDLEQIVEQADVCCKPYEESIEHLMAALDEAAKGNVEVSVEAPDDVRRKEMEEHANRLAETKGLAPTDAKDAPEAAEGPSMTPVTDAAPVSADEAPRPTQPDAQPASQPQEQAQEQAGGERNTAPEHNAEAAAQDRAQAAGQDQPQQAQPSTSLPNAPESTAPQGSAQECQAGTEGAQRGQDASHGAGGVQGDEQGAPQTATPGGPGAPAGGQPGAGGPSR